MATIIDPAEAESLIQEFRDQNSAAGGPALITPDKKSHHGFFIDRTSLEDLLRNPNVVGVSIDFAKHPKFSGTQENVFTIILSGAEPSSPGSATPYVKSGKRLADPPPCPPFCTK